MRIRTLKTEDAPLMLEWMHDDSVVHDLKADFSKKTLEDCIAFIQAAENNPTDLHLAIADENDEYMGTVSLKHICNDTAEFGITIRKCAMGKGMAGFAMKEILQTGFAQYHLQQVYWCVDPNNKRAVRFYEKNGYQKITAPENASAYTEEEKQRYLWYSVTKEMQQ